MNKIQLANDVYALEYEELTPYLTYVYLIIRGETLFIIDTFCGSDYMEEIKKMYPAYRYCVINTHYHFDHIWGNAAFNAEDIYAHFLCKDAIMRHGKEDYLKNKHYLKGKTERIYPRHLIKERYFFKEAKIELIYTPGHSKDSISVYDHVHQWLFAGDNLEKPIIQLERQNLVIYKDTLQKYLQLPIERFYGGHTLHLTRADIQYMITYLERIEKGESMYFDDPHVQAVHLKNLK
ncbi:MBL fold metallo-hydrolase [Beduini massiliensis]|uniref:MBL fold metallo-hydrolase n=1 Tax=Beduini massiliensis TaxID=1585974 RepID=UPI00059AA666|nr:MBL fold metallo-hydrolase [Beduini massiliensis]